MIKLIASDFDGTLYAGKMASDSVGSVCVSQRTIDAINEFRARGGIFVLCTGRMFPAIRPYALSLGLSGELVAHQGAGVFDIESQECLNSILIDVQTAHDYLSVMEKYGVCQAYLGSDYYIAEENEYSARYKQYTGIQYKIAGMPLSQYVLERGEPIYKVYSTVKPNRKLLLVPKCKKLFKGKLLLSDSSPINIEAVNIAAGKSVGLDWIAQKYGVAREEIMAFGDALNDVDMLEYAGVGVAVGNASKQVKRRADLIADDCVSDGVAKIIEQYVLKS